MEKEVINEKEEKKRKKVIILIIIYILSLLLLIISSAFTFSIFIDDDHDGIYNDFRVGEASMEFLDNKETNIKLIDAYPMSYHESLNLKPFQFRVTNTGTLPLIYRLRLEDVPDEQLKDTYGLERLNHNKIRFSLIEKKTKQVVKTGLVNEIKKGILLTEKLLPRYSKEFEFRLWIDKDAGSEVQAKYYVGKIILEVNDVLKYED